MSTESEASKQQIQKYWRKISCHVAIDLHRLTNFCSKTKESLENRLLKARNHLELLKHLLSHWCWSTIPLTIHRNIIEIWVMGLWNFPLCDPLLCWKRCVLDILFWLLFIYEVKKIYSWERNNWKWLHARNESRSFHTCFLKLLWWRCIDLQRTILGGEAHYSPPVINYLLENRKSLHPASRPLSLFFFFKLKGRLSVTSPHKPRDALGKRLIQQIRNKTPHFEPSTVDFAIWNYSCH